MRYIISGANKLWQLTFILSIAASSVAFAVVNTEDLNIDSPFTVPVPFINSGNLFVIGSGSIIGDLLDAPSLHFGQDKDGNINVTNFTADGNIGGVPIIEIHTGSTFTSAYQVSGVSDILKVDVGATANFDFALSVGGAFLNNGTTGFGNDALITAPNFTNNGSLNIAATFVTPIEFANNGDLYVIGNGSIHGDLTNGSSLNIGADSLGNLNANNFVIYDAIENIPVINVSSGSSFIINPATDFSLAGTITGLGTIVNNGVLTSAGAAVISTDNFANAGNFNIANVFTVPNTFTNTGYLYVVGAGNIVGDLDGGASLNFGIDSADTINPVNFTMLGNVSNVYDVSVYSGVLTTDANSNFSGIGALNIYSGAAANFDGAYDGGDANNYGDLIISNAFGGGVIYNRNSANLYLQGGVNAISSSIINDVGANLNIISDLEMTGMSITNNGTIKAVGNRNVNINSYVSPGTHEFHIHGQDLYDSINVNSAVDLTNGTVNVYSSFVGSGNQTYTWNLVTAPSITTNNTTVNLPESSILRTWESTINNDTITVSFDRMSFVDAAAGVNPDIAIALDQLADTHSHAAHDLVFHVSACNSVAEWNTNFNSLVPVASSNIKYVAIQNSTLNRVEIRIAATQNNTPSTTVGIATGDIDLNTSMWLAGFGSVAHQQTTDTITGYNATAAGGLMGVDKHTDMNSVYGLALGWSNSNIDESADNDINTQILGYHAILYGSKNINNNNFFEWLLTAIVNNNSGSRIVNINGINFNVASNYHNMQGGFRFNLGQYIDFETWKYSQIETIRYTMLGQPGYNETGSPAALHVASQGIASILTLGIGSRISTLNSDKWLAGTRELRAMVTYDVVSSGNATTANFIVGGSDFTISNNASRLALQLGASYGLSISNNMQLEFSYDFELRDKYTDNSGEIKLRYMF